MILTSLLVRRMKRRAEQDRYWRNIALLAERRGHAGPISDALVASALGQALPGRVVGYPQTKVTVTVEGPGFPLPPRPALPTRPTCHGMLLRHRDGTTECHAGRDDCIDGSRYQHTTTLPCTEQSHGCGICQTTPTGGHQ